MKLLGLLWLPASRKTFNWCSFFETTRAWLKFSSSYPSRKPVVKTFCRRISGSLNTNYLWRDMWKHLHRTFFSSRTLPSFCRVAKHKVKILSLCRTSMTIFSIFRLVFSSSMKNISREASLVVLNIMIFLLCSLRATQAIRDEIYQRLFCFRPPHTPSTNFFRQFHNIFYHFIHSEAMLLCEISIRRKKGDKKRRDEMCLTGRLSVVCKISSLRITKHFTSLNFLIICGYQGIIFIPDKDYFLGRKKALHKLSNLVGEIRPGEPHRNDIY